MKPTVFLPNLAEAGKQWASPLPKNALRCETGPQTPTRAGARVAREIRRCIENGDDEHGLEVLERVEQLLFDPAVLESI